jgi:hypothetical protein
MNNMFLLALIGVVAYITWTIVQAYAISSIDELENQINEGIGYRAELIDYLNKHNLTLPSAEIMPISELEAY